MSYLEGYQAMSADVLFSTLDCANGTSIGLAVLNSPSSLNALSHSMNKALTGQLRAWAKDPKIALVLLRGAGEKVFCAGGDIKYLYQNLIKTPVPSPEVPAQYFSTEYSLDLRIYHYPKPIVVWGNGIVMGGGMGLMQGARRRLVTETSRLAMPEAMIGLVPDVGGSWFLNRLPGRLGLFLAMTGASLNAHDALRIGLADRALPSTCFDELVVYLCQQPWVIRDDNIAVLDRALTSFSMLHEAVLPESNIPSHLLRLQTLMQCGGLEDVVAAILALDEDGEDPWLRQAAKNLSASSPTAVAVCWEIHRRLRLASLAEVFQSELNLAINFCLQHDFVEGVRARLIDKDNQPKWKPATLAEVQLKSVNKYFEDPLSNDEHPLSHANVNEEMSEGLMLFQEMVSNPNPTIV